MSERPVYVVVNDALTYGSLLHRDAGYGRSLTLGGKRRITIRVQADVFRAFYSPETGPPYYPDLQPAIRAAVDAWRETRHATAMDAREDDVSA
jgi:hypothetical protein